MLERRADRVTCLHSSCLSACGSRLAQQSLDLNAVMPKLCGMRRTIVLSSWHNDDAVSALSCRRTTRMQTHQQPDAKPVPPAAVLQTQRPQVQLAAMQLHAHMLSDLLQNGHTRALLTPRTPSAKAYATLLKAGVAHERRVRAASLSPMGMATGWEGQASRSW